MSRHVIGRADGGQLAIGWDPPLQTFWCQVYGPEPEGFCEDPECELERDYPGHEKRMCTDNSPTVWLGAAPKALPTLQNLEFEMGAELWAEVSGGVRGVLISDRRVDR